MIIYPQLGNQSMLFTLFECRSREKENSRVVVDRNKKANGGEGQNNNRFENLVDINYSSHVDTKTAKDSFSAIIDFACKVQFLNSNLVTVQ